MTEGALQSGRWVPAGWSLVGWTAVAVGAMSVAIISARGGGTEGLSALLVATARTSAILFTGAFVASAARRRWRTPLTAWLVRNRRYVGVSFAVSHAVHLAAIAANRVVSGVPYDPTTLVGGGIAYVFVFAMAATSFDRAITWLGARRWKLLHTTGLYVIWSVFALTLLPRATQPVSAAFAAWMLAALAFRMTNRRRRKA